MEQQFKTTTIVYVFTFATIQVCSACVRQQSLIDIAVFLFTSHHVMTASLPNGLFWTRAPIAQTGRSIMHAWHEEECAYTQLCLCYIA